MRVWFWFNFTLRHSDIHQQQKKQKPGQHHHHHHLGRRSSRRSSSVSVGLCAVPHDEESKLRTEASPRVSGRFALKHAPVLLRAAGKKFQPLREKKKKRKKERKNKLRAQKGQRNISTVAALFFPPSQSYKTSVTVYGTRGGCIALRQRGCCIKSCLRSLLLRKLHLLSLQMWIDVSLMANSCSG